MAVCEFAKMEASGWNDNNPVHTLSTADASMPRTHIVRQRGSTKLQIPLVLSIPKYTNDMQCVGRHNQLRSRFALASRHGSYKYYIMHQLAQLDIGITNAGILNFEAHPEL
jgi:hypothetical protein